MSKALFEQQQETAMINRSNLPPDFIEERFYKEVNTQQSRAYRVTPKQPLTDAERIAQGEAFAIIDEYDRRNRGQQFEN
jgi:hypothetical protein